MCPVQSVAMVPLLVYGELVALFGIARNSWPFRAREIGWVEDVIGALAERTVVMGWAEWRVSHRCNCRTDAVDGRVGEG